MAKGTLSQEVILRAALAVVDSGGLGSLSIRQLATELGVTPMAIYRHYPNKAAIESDLVDLVVGDFAVTEHNERDIGRWLTTTCCRMREGMLRHPGIITLLERGLYQGTHAKAVMAVMLARVQKAGLSDGEAVTLLYTLIAFTIGSVVINPQAGDPITELSHHGAEEIFRQGLARIMAGGQ